MIHNNTYPWGQTHTIIHRDGVGIVSVSVYNEELDVAWIHGLSVISGYRRRGIGTELLHLAEREARMMGVSKIKLEYYEPFVGEWYRNNGYEFLETEDDGATVLLKKLD